MARGILTYHKIDIYVGGMTCFPNVPISHPKKVCRSFISIYNIILDEQLLAAFK